MFDTSHYSSESITMDDIAVIGMGLRFPGRASSAEGLWSVMTEAESQWSAFPSDRLNIQGFYHPSRNRQGSVGSPRLLHHTDRY
jgi:acyl transferase domain-containing protein